MNGLSSIITLLGLGILIYGWIMNIVHLATDAVFTPLTGEVVIGVIGIFVVPIGSVMGLLV
jgi:hypothetical protein